MSPPHQAQQDMGSLVLRPSRHHPHSPPPRALPTAGKHNQAPLELERAGWEGKPLPMGGPSQPPGFTCEICRNS